MMLMRVLALTALFASDVAETIDSLGPEETQHHLDKRDLVKGPCPEDWFYFPSLKACHRFFQFKKTWEDAEVMCNAQPHYANLVTVSSPEHDEFIAKVIDTVSNSNTPAWIGLNDLCQEGFYKWIDGTPLTYQHWSDTQLDTHNDLEDCVVMNYFKEGSWNDVECGSGHGFVCFYYLHDQ